MTVLDHIFATLLGVGYTAYAWWSYRRVRPALTADEPGVRRREYRITIVWLWLLCLAAVGLWLLAGRPLTELGLGLEIDWPFAVGAALVVAALAFLALQTRWIATDERARARAREQLGPVEEYLPRARDELRLFFGLSLTAGFCEEVLYRGYLLWYVDQLAGLGVSVALTSIIFGVTHLGHGYDANLRASLLGVVFAGLYLLGGSLWVPILLHAGIDLAAGLAGWFTRPR